MSDRDEIAEIIHEANWQARGGEWRFCKASAKDKALAYIRADEVLRKWVTWDREKVRAQAHNLLSAVPAEVHGEYASKRWSARVAQFIAGRLQSALDADAIAKYESHRRAQVIDQMADALAARPHLIAVEWLREQSRLTHQGVQVAHVPVRQEA